MRNWPFARFLLEEHLKKPKDGTEYGVTALPGDAGPEGAPAGTGGTAGDSLGSGVLGGQNLAVSAVSPRQADAASSSRS